MNDSTIQSTLDHLRSALDAAGLSDVAIENEPPYHQGVVMAFRARHPLLSKEGEALWFMRHRNSPIPETCDDFVQGISSMISHRLELSGNEGCTGPVDDWDVLCDRLLVQPIHAYLARLDGWNTDVEDFEHSDNPEYTIAGNRDIDRFTTEYTSSWDEDVMTFALWVDPFDGVNLHARPKPGLPESHPPAKIAGLRLEDVVDLPDDDDRPDLRDLAAGTIILSAFWTSDEHGPLLAVKLDASRWVEWGKLDPFS